MNIKALPSAGSAFFCCICFVESAVCSNFAERIIRGLPGGALETSAPPERYQQSKKYTNRATLVHFLLWQAAKPSGDKCTP